MAALVTEIVPPPSFTHTPLSISTAQAVTTPRLVAESSNTTSPIPAASSSSPKRIRHPSATASPISPRSSQRQRKPSAKLIENAGARPSVNTARNVEVKEEIKPGPVFLQPDHLPSAENVSCELNNGAKPPISNKSRWEAYNAAQTDYLSPEDDPLALRGIPVFRPTMEEFQDFEAYVTRTAPWGMRSGITKVIPPPEWTDALPPMNPRTLSEVQIKSPIQQNMMGNAGIFRATNIEKNKSRPLSVREWFDKCQDAKFAGPPVKQWDRDSKEAKTQREEAMKEKKERELAKKAEWRRKRESKAAQREAQAEIAASMDTVEGDHTGIPALDPSSSGSSHSSPDPPVTPEVDPVDPWYKETDFKTAWLPRNTTADDYTTEACAKLQEKYWKTMGLGEPSWYGADLMQAKGDSVLDLVSTSRSFRKLAVLNPINCVVPGVNEPYLYFGMWRATFAWHVEDMDLFSINYIHFGAPKFWYAIPQGQAEQLERFLANEFPIDANNCDQFIRHKSMAISPTRLKDAGIRVNMLTHHQNEFVITYPKGYHAGFNMGFNCAESVNFALDSWIEYGRKAKHCRCVSHSVRIDVDKMLAEAADAVHQPPGIKVPKRQKRLEGDQDVAAVADDEAPRPKKRPRQFKIKGETELAGAPAYRGTDAEDIITLDTHGAESADFAMDDFTSQSGPLLGKTKRASKPRKSLVSKDKPIYPCVFCPSISTEDLLLVADPNEFIKSQWRGTEGEPITVHVQCAQATPECVFEDRSEDGKEVTYVMGVNDVLRDRWKLKCKVCETKALAASGVKVQCTKGKCPLAFHYSCAVADERVKAALWLVDQSPSPRIGSEDGAISAQPAQEPSSDVAQAGDEAPKQKLQYLKLELLCPAHTPEQQIRREREKAEELRQNILSIVPGELVKMKSGTSYKLISVDEDNKMVVVEVGPTEAMHLPWSKVDFRPAVPKVVENEYARHHTHSRKTDGAATNSVTAAEGDDLVQARMPSIAVAKPKTVKKPRVSKPKQSIPGSGGPAQSSFPAVATPSVFQPPNQNSSYPMPSHSHPHPHPQPIYRQPMPPAPSHLHQTPQYYQQLPPPPPPRPQAYSQHPRQVYHPRPPTVLPNRVYCVDGLQVHHEGHHGHSGYPPYPPYPSYPHYPPHPSQQYHPTNNGYSHLPYTSQPQYVNNGPPHFPQPYSNSYHPKQPGSAGPVIDPYRRHSVVSHTPDPLSLPQDHSNPRHAAPVQAEANYHHPAGTTMSSASSSSNGGPRGMSHLMNPSPGMTSSLGSRPSASTHSNGPPAGSAGIGKIDLGLERMERLMAAFPPLRVPAIHLAGTNGKGSVSAMLDSCLCQAGLRSGRYNSPHLLEPRDSIRIGGRPVSRSTYDEAISTVAGKAQQLGLDATTFEISTAAAYLIFNQSDMDVMIIECGMGGARDATNVIPAHLVLATALTSIGMDHVAMLGGSLESIATEKASIAKKGGTMFSTLQTPVVQDVVMRVTAQIGADCRIVDKDHACRDVPSRTPFTLRPFSGPPERLVTVPHFGPELATKGVSMPLPGSHQLDNLTLAITILHYLRADQRALSIQPRLANLTAESVSAGISNTKWSGRCSWLQANLANAPASPILVDGAHNADSAGTLRRYITSLNLGSATPPVTFILALSDSKGKSIESVLQPLLRQGDAVAALEFTTPVESMPWIKPVPTSDVVRVAKDLVGNDKVWTGSSGVGASDNGSKLRQLEEALIWAEGREGLTVVCGSLYLVADVYRLLGMDSDSM